MSKFMERAKEKGWTDPYSWVFPVVFSTVIRGLYVWRNGFDGSTREWAALVISWVFGVVLVWVLYVMVMPKKWRGTQQE